eukprot:scaffold3619_cov328-Prasinococcus_capsulatus_cf.AAC.4
MSPRSAAHTPSVVSPAGCSARRASCAGPLLYSRRLAVHSRAERADWGSAHWAEEPTPRFGGAARSQPHSQRPSRRDAAGWTPPVLMRSASRGAGAGADAGREAARLVPLLVATLLCAARRCAAWRCCRSAGAGSDNRTRTRTRKRSSLRVQVRVQHHVDVERELEREVERELELCTGRCAHIAGHIGGARDLSREEDPILLLSNKDGLIEI